MMASLIKSVLGSRFLTRSVLGTFTPRVLVLAYHDLRSDDDFPSWMRVSCSAFTEQLEEYRRWGRFIAPDELFDWSSMDKDRLNILITFDDGYRNNHRLALPVLKEFDAPALFFVSTHNLLTGEFFWFDRIITLIQSLHLVSLDLREQGLTQYSFGLGDAMRRWDDIQELLKDLKALGNSDHPTVKRVLGFLDGFYDEETTDKLSEYRPLNREEIREMSNSGLCSFGSHSHKHDILTRMEDGELRHNLELSRQVLTEVTEKPIRHIAYPNGDADSRVRKFSAQQGFEFGYGTVSKFVLRNGDRLSIPRLLIGGFDTLSLIRYQMNRAALST